VRRLRAESPSGKRLTRADLVGGLAAGWLVFACSFPAAIPFLFIDDPHRALRVSNAVLLALLFAVGYRAARLTLAKPWIVGSVFLLAGLVLVVITIALGG
jgi:VIT1/CCC1 family predicted Fe2+/Mn2+ transporter